MPRFAANISFLFRELPFLERFEAAAEAGFQAVEILFPYDDPAPAILERLQRAGLPLALINMPPPNYTGGARGFAAIPGGEDRFRRDFARAMRYADRLSAGHIHVMTGNAEGDAARRALIENLRWAATEIPDQSLTIEPINPVDMPGYFLNDFDQAAGIIEAVGAANLGLQFDAYHAHRVTGDVMGSWEKHRGLVRHVQIADHPGRHEPGSGEIDYATFFARLDADGYAGFVSAEYHPRESTAAGLGWVQAPLRG